MVVNVYDPYPDEIELDGKTYRLNMDFRRVLQVIDLEQDKALMPEDRIELQARLLLRDDRECPPELRDQARLIAAAFDLIPKNEDAQRGEKYLDLHQDAAMIRSAFFRIGVDLSRDSLHIIQFLELLADLPADTALMRTVEIRRKPIPAPNKHNAEQIAELQKAKARVAIKYSEEERMARFAESLKNSTVMRG